MVRAPTPSCAGWSATNVPSTPRISRTSSSPRPEAHSHRGTKSFAERRRISTTRSTREIQEIQNPKSKIESLPLDRARRLRRDVIDDAIDPPHFVDDSARNAVQYVVGHAIPVGGHEVGRLDRSNRENVLIRSLVTHHPHAADRQQHGKRLGGLAIEVCFSNLIDHDLIGVLKNLDALGGHFSEDADGESGAGKGVAPHELFLEAELDAKAPDFVLEELAHRFDELQTHLLG